MNRKQLQQSDFDEALGRLKYKLGFRQNQKGMGAFCSSHEALGVIIDELQEFRDEVHAKSGKEPKTEYLLDIAVGCIWSIASLQADAMDW